MPASSAPAQPAPDTAADPWFQDRFAARIGGANFAKGSGVYKFELIKRAKRQALAEHPERRMLDFGIGENDEPAPESVRAVMRREVDRPENRGYADNGIAEFKAAAAAFMEREFGVVLDPVKEVNHCIGSKTAYAMLPAAFIDPGDVTLMTVPGYPVAGTATKWFGGTVHPLPLVPEHGFLPDLAGIPDDVLARTKLLVLCYPNSPTGRTANRSFYERVVDWAHKHRVIVIQDAAHMMLSYDDAPLSFLSIDGAKEVGLEVHSMSKGFHMIGWRMGWVCGHERSRTTATRGSSSPSKRRPPRRSPTPRFRGGCGRSIAVGSRSWWACCGRWASTARCPAAPTSSIRRARRRLATGPSPPPRRPASF